MNSLLDLRTSSSDRPDELHAMREAGGEVEAAILEQLQAAYSLSRESLEFRESFNVKLRLVETLLPQITLEYVGVFDQVQRSSTIHLTTSPGVYRGNFRSSYRDKDTEENNEGDTGELPLEQTHELTSGDLALLLWFSEDRHSFAVRVNLDTGDQELELEVEYEQGKQQLRVRRSAPNA